MRNKKELLMLGFGLMALGVGFASCAPFRDSPFSDQLLRSERELNRLALERIGNIEQDGKIRIAVMADSHQNYKDLDFVIGDINKAADIDFVVNLGDLTNSAYNLEYDQFLDSFVLLRQPALTAIGNHDAIGAGPSLFKKAFGESNFWFESTSRRFVFFNSVNLEDPEEFDPNWLLQAVQSSSKPVIIFSHVNLRDPERYSGATAQTFNTIISDSKVALILNGHNHIFEVGVDNGTVMLQCPRVEGPQWLLLEIQGTQLSITHKNSGAQVWQTLKN